MAETATARWMGMLGVGSGAPTDAVASLRARGVMRAGLAVAVLIIFVAASSAWQLRESAIAEVRSELRRMSVLLAEQIARSFEAVDLVVREVAEEVERSGITDPDSFHRAFRTEQMHHSMARRHVNLPQLEAVGLIDAEGRAAISTRAWPTPPFTIADRSYFLAQLHGDGTRPFISEAVANRVNGGATAYLSRRISAADGTFLGVVTAAVRLAHFNEVFEAAEFESGTGVVLSRQDGLILKRFPIDADGPGGRISAPAWYALRQAGGGPFDSAGETDGLGPRFAHARAIERAGLFVNVTRLQHAALAQWRLQAGALAVAALGALLGVSFLVRSLTRHFTAMEQSHLDLARHAAALTLSEAKLAEQSQVLQTTLEHMNQGLIMVDAQGRIGVWNRRAAELLDLPASAFAHPAGFAGLTELQRSRGEFAELPAAQREAVDHERWMEHPHVYERRRPNGAVIEVRSVELRTGGMVRTYTDITARAEAEAMLAIAASHDHLTGLANRSGFGQRLDLALETARRGGKGFALLCLDLDGFKAVNDTRGHAVGDLLLQRVADRMRESLRGHDLLARMGGDEFAILLPDADSAIAQQVAQRMLAMVRLPCLIDGEAVGVGVSIGIAVHPQDGGTAEDLLRNADVALYQAKHDGRNCYRLHAGGHESPEHKRRDMEAALRLAVENQDFRLAYQPICDTTTGEAVGFEALLRWQHSGHGQVAPGEFIPLAEQTGLIVPLGRWALMRACAAAASWPMPVRIAVNLSPAQFQAADLVEMVEEALAQTGLDPQRLELEITEALLLDHAEEVIGPMNALRRKGVRLVLDDFGTANSNLSYLRGFPLDAVKIDRSFLRALSTDRQARAMVEAMVTLARTLDLEVVGEGVETPEQLAMLRHLRCDRVQGYLLGRPDTAVAANERLARHAARPDVARATA